MSQHDAPNPLSSPFTVDPEEWEAAELDEAFPDITPSSYLARLALTNHQELKAGLQAGHDSTSPGLRAAMNFGDAFQKIHEAVTRRYALGQPYEDAVTAAGRHMLYALATTPPELLGQGKFALDRVDDITTIIGCYTAEADIHSAHFYNGAQADA